MSKEKKALQSLSLEELKSKETELRQSLFKLKLQKVTGQLANSSLLGLNRKNLARVKTFITEKQELKHVPNGTASLKTKKAPNSAVRVK